MAIIGIAMVFSNQSAAPPNGGTSVSNDVEYANARAKMEEISLPLLKAYDAGTQLSAAEMKKLREAGELVDGMNLYQPMISGLFYLSGRIHVILGEPNIAEERFRQCVLLAPANITAHPADAEKIKLTAADANYQLSMLLLLKRDIRGSFKSADEAVKVAPENPDYLVARASALNEARKLTLAKADLKRALALEPNLPRAKALLKLVDEQLLER